MDTQYTQGFKAGMAWREAEIIKLLNDLVNKYGDEYWHVDRLTALIKAEK
jgi:hypothetical protein